MTVKVVESSTLNQIMTAALQKREMLQEHIGYVVKGLVEASLRGIDTHGVRLFPTYLRELDGGRSLVRPEVYVESTGKAVATVDANHALGLVAGMIATKEAIQLCKAHGVGAVAVRNSNHFGAASYYTLEIAKYNLVGMSFSNSDALVAPFNGRSPLFGTNPLSLAAPGEKDEVFCVDMATSQVSYSKVKRCWENGTRLEVGWAIDDQGEDVARSGREPVTLAPLGGYKGQCLAMLVEILCALLTGAPLACELAHFYSEPFHKPHQVGHFFIALDIALFQNVLVFKQRLSQLMSLTRSQKPMNGISVFAPGDIERDSAMQRRVNGIPLEDWEFHQFQRLAEEVNLPLRYCQLEAVTSDSQF